MLKCASEIMEIRNAVLAQQEADALAKADSEYNAAILAAIQFCETEIAEMLEEKATDYQNQKEWVMIQIPIKFYRDKRDRLLFHPIERIPNVYADGGPSYEPNEKISYSWDTLKSYLEKYCYKVTDDGEKVLPRYCYGNHHYKCIVIRAEPEC